MKRSTNGRLGKVSRNAGPVTESAYPTEKSAANFMDTSIHRLPYWQVNLREFGASLLTNEARNICRNAREMVVL